MKKMMILTLALSVMAMGSAMANDSVANVEKSPKKVNIEVNYICDGHGHGHYAHYGHSHKAVKPMKYDKSYRGNKHNRMVSKRFGVRRPGCPLCEDLRPGSRPYSTHRGPNGKGMGPGRGPGHGPGHGLERK